MLFSLSCIMILGFSLSSLFKKVKLPGILAMIITGMILGPSLLNLIAPSVLQISAEIRTMALVIILLRAGLSLNLSDLKKVGRPALLLCILPASFEIICLILIGPFFFGITRLEAAIMGAVLAAVSPAVVVPRMLYLMENGYGQCKRIPQLIMAGASIDDIYVIVLFTSLIKMFQGEGFNWLILAKVPSAIIFGALLGILGGYFLLKLMQRVAMSEMVKIFVIISITFLFLSAETFLEDYVAISGLIAVMSFGAFLAKYLPKESQRLSKQFANIWVVAELFLFVLVGATVDFTVISQSGMTAVIVVLIALIFRLTGVYVSLLNSGLTNKEKLFCGIAYLPKATVQAAIGSIPLTLGMPAGKLIVAVAVIAILVTAPLGAIGIDRTYTKLLTKD